MWIKKSIHNICSLVSNLDTHYQGFGDGAGAVGSHGFKEAGAGSRSRQNRAAPGSLTNMYYMY